MSNDDARFLRRTVWALLLVALAALIVKLAPVVLLLFASLLIAIVFDALAQRVELWLRLPHRWALLLAVLLLFVGMGLAIAFFGAQVQRQVIELQDALPQAWKRIEAWLSELEVGSRLLAALREWSPSGEGLARRLGDLAAGTFGALGALVLVTAAGIYLAAQPRTYRSGLLQLLPTQRRERGREVLALLSGALRAWLKAQGVAMLVVSLLTALGLWAIGVPSALALGLLAGLAEFVPVVGPIVAAVPALLLAASLGSDTLLWTVGLYVAIQQLEGNVLLPWVTRRAVELPPALALFSVFAFGSLLGPLGVLLGAPLAVVGFVLVRELLIEREDMADTAK